MNVKHVGILAAIHSRGYETKDTENGQNLTNRELLECTRVHHLSDAPCYKDHPQFSAHLRRP